MRAPQDVQRHAGGEPREVLRPRAAERARSDVRVAEGEHRGAGAAECLEQFDAAEGELLRVVDEDRAHAPRRAPRRRAGRQRAGEAHRLAHETRSVAVRPAQPREHRLIVDREGRQGHPDLAIRTLASGGEGRRRDAERRALGEERAQLRTEPAGGADLGAEPRGPAPRALRLVLGVAVEEVLHDPVLVGSGEQLRLVETGVHRVRAHQLIGEGRHRARERARRRDAHRDREAVAQRRRRLPGGREHEHLLGRETRREQRAHTGDDGRGLARSRCTDDDTGCLRRELDDGALSRIKGHGIHAIRPVGHDRTRRGARRVRAQRAPVRPAAHPRRRRVS